jgi:hypothetical protein
MGTQLAMLPLATHVASRSQAIESQPVRPALHVSTAELFELQRDSPGEQAGGVHVAVDGLQSAAVAQGVPFCQLPFDPQVCGTFPLQPMLPGAHCPPHMPVLLLQTNMQAGALFIQCPA